MGEIQNLVINENLILSLNSLGIELAKPGELNDDDKTYSNIDFNGYKLYVNGKAIN